MKEVNIKNGLFLTTSLSVGEVHKIIKELVNSTSYDGRIYIFNLNHREIDYDEKNFIREDEDSTFDIIYRCYDYVIDERKGVLKKPEY